MPFAAAHWCRGFRSLSSSLTAWYAFACFVLVSVATGSLYEAVADRTRARETELVLERIHMLNEFERSPESWRAYLVREVEHEWRGGPEAAVYARILDSEGRVVTAEFAGCYVVCVYTPNARAELVRLPYRMKGTRPSSPGSAGWSGRSR